MFRTVAITQIYFSSTIPFGFLWAYPQHGRLSLAEAHDFMKEIKSRKIFMAQNVK